MRTCLLCVEIVVNSGIVALEPPDTYCARNFDSVSRWQMLVECKRAFGKARAVTKKNILPDLMNPTLYVLMLR